MEQGMSLTSWQRKSSRRGLLTGAIASLLAANIVKASPASAEEKPVGVTDVDENIFEEKPWWKTRPGFDVVENVPPEKAARFQQATYADAFSILRAAEVTNKFEQSLRRVADEENHATKRRSYSSSKFAQPLGTLTQALVPIASCSQPVQTLTEARNTMQQGPKEITNVDDLLRLADYLARARDELKVSYYTLPEE